MILSDPRDLLNRLEGIRAFVETNSNRLAPNSFVSDRTIFLMMKHTIPKRLPEVSENPMLEYVCHENVLSFLYGPDLRTPISKVSQEEQELRLKEFFEFLLFEYNFVPEFFDAFPCYYSGEVVDELLEQFEDLTTSARFCWCLLAGILYPENNYQDSLSATELLAQSLNPYLFASEQIPDQETLFEHPLLAALEFHLGLFSGPIENPFIACMNRDSESIYEEYVISFLDYEKMQELMNLADYGQRLGDVFSERETCETFNNLAAVETVSRYLLIKEVKSEEQLPVNYVSR